MKAFIPQACGHGGSARPRNPAARSRRTRPARGGRVRAGGQASKLFCQGVLQEVSGLMRLPWVWAGVECRGARIRRASGRVPPMLRGSTPSLRVDGTVETVTVNNVQVGPVGHRGSVRSTPKPSSSKHLGRRSAFVAGVIVVAVITFAISSSKTRPRSTRSTPSCRRGKQIAGLHRSHEWWNPPRQKRSGGPRKPNAPLWTRGSSGSTTAHSQSASS